MTGESDAWFAVGESESAADRIRDGTAAEPADWPRLAVERGFVADEEAYTERLHEASIAATRAAVRERERADDQQLIHAVRAMDDTRRIANELAERVDEWAGSLFALGDARATTEDTSGEVSAPSNGDDDRATAGDEATETEGDAIAYARRIASKEPETATERRVVTLAERVTELAAETEELAAFVERTAPATAPNLAALAGPTLAARLIALAGGLESLAKKPAGTVQVLGAEEALFAHLRGHAPSPKHGVIFTHPYVHGTRPEDRGSAARALAGKLAIAARVDHYSGDRRPELDEELDERIARIRARADDGGSSDE